MFEVTDAKRESLIGAIALIGASGAGKTLSMLKIAKGFMDRKHPDMSDADKWQKVGVIDTEHRRSKIYAGTSSFGLDIGSFKHLNFEAPYSVGRLDAAIKFLKDKHGVELIIIDSTSHFWDGEGGMLDLQQSFGGNFQAWREVNPHYEHFISLVTGDKYGIDMLNGIRAKQHYEVSQNEVGKLKVEKMGLKPTQRDSLEYEFHIALNIDMDHVATAMKDNSGIFSGPPRQIESVDGEKLHDWLKTGADPRAEQRKKEQAELEEKTVMINHINAFAESKVPGMFDYVNKAIKATVAKFGALENLRLDQLQEFLHRVNNKEQELKEKQEKEGNAAAKELDDFQEQEKKTVEGLRETAKSFKIKGYSKMKKDELIEAIREAQGKPLSEAVKESKEKNFQA